jgi:hypothetical protein
VGEFENVVLEKEGEDQVGDFGGNEELVSIASPYRTVNTICLCYKTRQLMLYREIIAVCSKIHTKHTSMICGIVKTTRTRNPLLQLTIALLYPAKWHVNAH